MWVQILCRKMLNKHSSEYSNFWILATLIFCSNLKNSKLKFKKIAFLKRKNPSNSSNSTFFFAVDPPDGKGSVTLAIKNNENYLPK